MIVAANGQTVMLDFCREYGSACGKPAADAFCRQKGHPDASRFQISEHIGHTAVISTNAPMLHASQIESDALIAEACRHLIGSPSAISGGDDQTDCS